ncbi:helix-turn-helix domain-containing protein [Streptacidiphilus sp. PB12-B1b]|uniref:methyltransferase n=1 Tax=Streptacidiphilus sp. PB12-B1b TaxID=2705012 RepID=UPI0015F980D2|nr:methyltransferase [Streptacidiphilus sp. PB12-B1b]QMU78147.1 helix-turn-helix domain-containing protein [Streptacidiphilus sp. PB12-B1b]
MTRTAPDVGTAAGILRLGNLFCDAKALLTAVRLDLFSALADEPAAPEELRERLGLHGRGLSDFLALLAALGLLRRDPDGRYRNADGAGRYLVPGRPGAVAGFLRGADLNLYPVYGRLTEALRTGRPQADGDFTGMLDDPVALGHFVRMMDGLTQGLGPQLIAALEGRPYRSLLDLGGCRGHLLGQLLAARPELRGSVFDLPQMEPFFDEYLAGLGLADRAAFHPGDFFRDPLPETDVLVLGHILHDWDQEQRRQLLDKAYAAVNPGGTVLIYDRMLGEARDDIENLVASLNMLLVTEGGAEYTVSEIEAQATAAGFGSVSHRPLADYDTLVICHKD